MQTIDIKTKKVISQRRKRPFNLRSMCDGTLDINSFIKKGATNFENTILVFVTGDSLESSHICDGDLVLVEAATHAKADVVVMARTSKGEFYLELCGKLSKDSEVVGRAATVVHHLGGKR
jgi:SOS-response transcriptional repressor LexA